MAVGFKETSIEVIHLPTEIPVGMPFAIDDCSVAHHLGFRNKIMWSVLINTLKHYTVFTIPKRKAGFRVIHAPSPMMKLLLQRVHVRFLVPMHAKLGPHVTAYRKGVSARSAVEQHVPACPICEGAEKGVTPKKHACPRRGLYLKMDLKNFFHTTTRAWIRGYFVDIGYSHEVAGILAGLLIVQDVPGDDRQKWYTRTPQGSPASGAVCNLVADQRLDAPILKYLESLNTRYSLTGEWAWKYTRYSDDLAFTCGINPSKEERLAIMEDIRNIIQEAGYRVNHKKTRVSHSYHTKRLLGMVFNDKPNYSKEEYLRVRAITHNCVTQGFETQFSRSKQKSAEAMVTWLRGKINWINQINPEKGSKLLGEFDVALAMHKLRTSDGSSE